VSGVLITGGTGNTGRALAEVLCGRAAIRVASRHPETGNEEHVFFDWHDPGSHDAALAGVDRVYLVPPIGAIDPMPATIEEDIQEELGHAQQFAARIKELYGTVPGSMDFRAVQGKLQPPEDQIDGVHVIKGVIDAEDGAIQHYTRIAEETEEVDPVTNDMVINILRNEQGHRRLFKGFLREYAAEGLA
jgi:ferritin-like protein